MVEWSLRHLFHFKATLYLQLKPFCFSNTYTQRKTHSHSKMKSTSCSCSPVTILYSQQGKGTTLHLLCSCKLLLLCPVLRPFPNSGMGISRGKKAQGSSRKKQLPPPHCRRGIRLQSGTGWSGKLNQQAAEGAQAEASDDEPTCSLAEDRPLECDGTF